ncbi:MAG: hypothetical protein NTY09_05250 [bacterium]|nr:hypothetical protein [bacterium]
MGTAKYKTRDDPRSVILMVIAIVLVYFVLSIVSFTVTSEDAYISFRYAENIAHGYGFVFNQGGEVVEGFSNPVWVFLLTATSFFGINTEFAGRCLGLLFGALTLIELILLFNVLNRKNNTIGFLAALCVATTPAVLFWFQAGLENALYLYLIVLSLRLVLDEDRDDEQFPYSWIPLALVTMTRPEGIIFPVMAGLWKYDRSANNSTEKARTTYFTWLFIVAICLLFFFTWRQIVFGEWVPNTYFAKVNNGFRYNFIAGLGYLLNSLKNTLWIPLALPFVSILLSNFKIDPDRKAFAILIGAMSLVYAIFILYAGGDIHPYDRFFVPFLVLSPIASFGLIGNEKNIGWLNTILVILVVGYLGGNILYSSPQKWQTEPPVTRPSNPLLVNISGLVSGFETPSGILHRFLNPTEDILEYVGRDLKNDQNFAGLLAVDQCGKIPYYYKGPVLDLLGLNDTEIARIVHSVETWDNYAVSVLNKTPDAFVFVYTGNHLISQYYLENTVMSVPFQDRYELSRIYHADNVFKLFDGSEYSFPLELLLYKPKQGVDLQPVSDHELAWLIDNEPIVDNPNGIADEVEAFRNRNRGNSERVVEIRVEYN